mgnify:CR=1 FL=1
MMIPTQPSVAFPGINRNILECKSKRSSRLFPSTSVLIETYWNVNSNMDTGLRLITGINRNILECKCCCLISFTSLYVVLIETYWNVNMLPHRRHP